MTRIRYKNDNLGIILDGDILRTSMMDNKSVDAVINRELAVKPKPMADAAMHRPGYRTTPILQRHTADAATDATSRDAREAAYMDYQRDLILAHKPAAERNEIMSQLADAAKDGEAMSAYARGLEEKDPDDEEEKEEDEDRKKGRKRQDARSAPHDEAACSHCGGSGIEPGHKQSGEEHTDAVLRRMQTGTELIVRRDVPDAKTLQKMVNQKIKTLDAFRQQDNEQLQSAWRYGK